MEGRGVHRSRDGDFQEPIVLPLASRHAPVFLGALDKLHTHFVLSELHQELIRDLDIELLVGLAEGRTIQLGGHLNQVVTAEEEVPFASCF